MSTQDSAADHLRVIRQLMERATLYRAISAPTALVGGVAALGLAWWHEEKGLTGREFVSAWLALFAVLAALNLALLGRDARRRQQPFLSSGMRLALKALVPPLLSGGVIGIVSAALNGDTGLAASVWAVFYGLALLATASFAPKSIVWLGRGFVSVGLFGYLGNQLGFIHLGDFEPFLPARLMAGTFGFLHIVYGVAVLVGSRRAGGAS